MGTIIIFDQKVRRKPRQDARETGGRILLFTGVRYEREPIVPSPKRTGARTTNRRTRRV